jgi:hypothetical protein
MLSRLKSGVARWRTAICSTALTFAGALAAVPETVKQETGIDWTTLVPNYVPTKHVGLTIVAISMAFTMLHYFADTRPRSMADKDPPNVEPNS